VFILPLQTYLEHFNLPLAQQGTSMALHFSGFQMKQVHKPTKPCKLWDVWYKTSKSHV